MESEWVNIVEMGRMGEICRKFIIFVKKCQDILSLTPLIKCRECIFHGLRWLRFFTTNIL